MRNALLELKRAGAVGLPPVSAIEAAKDGTEWSGKKGNGDPWSLKKNTADSYNCMC